VDAIAACVAALPPTSELQRLVLGESDGSVDGSVEALVASACARVLRGLSERSLVRWEPSSALVSMHRLLQTVVWESAPATERDVVAVACVVGMANGLTPLVKAVKSSGLACHSAATLRRWLPHGDAVHTKRVDVDALASQPHEQRVMMARLVSRVAGGYKVINQFDRAVQLYRKDLTMKRRLYSAASAHPAVASSLSNLASVLRTQNHLAESARLHREALEMWRRLHGATADHSDVAASLSSLANVLEVQGALEESARLHRESLEMRRRLHGDGVDYFDVAESLNNLAIVLKARGELVESERLHRESLEMRRRLHGAGVDSLDVATSLGNLANVLLLKGGDVAVDESVRLHRDSLSMRRRLHGDDADHLEVAASLRSLALAWRAQGDLAESERLHRESLAMYQRLYGVDTSHPDIAVSLGNLADVLEARGDVDECARLRRESSEMQRHLGMSPGRAQCDVAESHRLETSATSRGGVVVTAGESPGPALRAERDVLESYHPDISTMSRGGVIATGSGATVSREVDQLELRDGDVTVGEEIARGAFGAVHRAELRIPGAAPAATVAVCAKVRVIPPLPLAVPLIPRSLQACMFFLWRVFPSPPHSVMSGVFFCV
jgi:tetratricopeptide (TPR) repeat protein